MNFSYNSANIPNILGNLPLIIIKKQQADFYESHSQNFPTNIRSNDFEVKLEDDGIGMGKIRINTENLYNSQMMIFNKFTKKNYFCENDYDVLNRILLKVLKEKLKEKQNGKKISINSLVNRFLQEEQLGNQNSIQQKRILQTHIKLQYKLYKPIKCSCPLQHDRLLFIGRQDDNKDSRLVPMIKQRNDILMEIDRRTEHTSKFLLNTQQCIISGYYWLNYQKDLQYYRQRCPECFIKKSIYPEKNRRNQIQRIQLMEGYESTHDQYISSFLSKRFNEIQIEDNPNLSFNNYVERYFYCGEYFSNTQQSQFVFYLLADEQFKRKYQELLFRSRIGRDQWKFLCHLSLGYCQCGKNHRRLLYEARNSDFKNQPAIVPLENEKVSILKKLTKQIECGKYLNIKSPEMFNEQLVKKGYFWRLAHRKFIHYQKSCPKCNLERDFTKKQKIPKQSK